MDVTFPEVLARLSVANVASFEALQPHQEQPWYSFLVQLAAMAIARETAGKCPQDPGRWRDVIVRLAGSEEAWRLVVDDVSKPAFMQPPIPEDSIDDAGYKSDLQSPDDLDMLVLSKNFDVKQHRISHPRPEHWIYALITLQTLEGYMGRGNYGITRGVNGAYANRPLVGLAPDLTWGSRFRRDLGVLLNERERLLDSYEADGPALIWTISWDGSKGDAIPLYDCDPYYVEICRRIRFTHDNGLTCHRTTTKEQRIDAADELKGATGDPWTPVKKSDVKALNVGGSGFTYGLLQDIMFEGEYDRPPALEFTYGDEEGAYVVAQTLSRGQGKTEGLHRRVIFVPTDVRKRFTQIDDELERVGMRAKQRVSLADKVQRRVLYPAVAALLGSGDGDEVDYEDAAPWIEAFDEAVDEQFFDALWTSVEEEMSDQEARAHWEAILWREAEQVFDEAERGTPIADNRRWRARSRARSLFYGSAAQVFETAPYASDTSESDESNRQLA